MEIQDSYARPTGSDLSGLRLFVFFVSFLCSARTNLLTLAMSISLLIGITKPGVGFWASSSARFTIAYWSLTLSLNVILTTLIAGRLWYMRQEIRGIFGKEHAKTYTSIMAMLIESASIITVFDLIFVVSYARNSNVQNLALPPLGVGQVNIK